MTVILKKSSEYFPELNVILDQDNPSNDKKPSVGFVMGRMMARKYEILASCRTVDQLHALATDEVLELLVIATYEGCVIDVDWPDPAIDAVRTSGSMLVDAVLRARGIKFRSTEYKEAFDRGMLLASLTYGHSPESWADNGRTRFRIVEERAAA